MLAPAAASTRLDSSESGRSTLVETFGRTGVCVSISLRIDSTETERMKRLVTKLDDNGQPQVHNPSGLIAITVAGGDSNTGRTGDVEPKTSASKGDTTSRAMLENAYLFPEMEEEARAQLEKMNRRQTWFLLVHRDLVGGEMRCELSMPISMSEDRRIDGWAERVLLRSTSFDAALLQGIPDEPAPLTEEVKIELKRRA